MKVKQSLDIIRPTQIMRLCDNFLCAKIPKLCGLMRLLIWIIHSAYFKLTHMLNHITSNFQQQIFQKCTFRCAKFYVLSSLSSYMVLNSSTTFFTKLRFFQELGKKMNIKLENVPRDTWKLVIMCFCTWKSANNALWCNIWQIMRFNAISWQIMRFSAICAFSDQEKLHIFDLYSSTNNLRWQPIVNSQECDSMRLMRFGLA